MHPKTYVLLILLLVSTLACTLAPPTQFSGEPTATISRTEAEIVPTATTSTPPTQSPPTPTISPTSIPTMVSKEPITLTISIYILDDTSGQLSSNRSGEQLEGIYERVNEIWEQADIVLEVQHVERVSVPPIYLQAIALRDFQRFFDGVGTDIQLTEPGLINAFYARDIGGPNGINPFGSRVFFVTDEPSVHHERVTSHEIGHILGLHHVLDDPNRLMFSGTNGMMLSEEEVTVTRYTAQGLLDGVR